MANVYKAKCHRLDRLVAVKILHSDLAQNADFRRRFMDESRAVAQLSHPNIVSVYDVSCSDEMCIRDRVNNRYRYRVTVIGRNDKTLRGLLSAFMKEFSRRPEHKALHIYPDCNLMDC